MMQLQPWPILVLSVSLVALAPNANAHGSNHSHQIGQITGLQTILDDLQDQIDALTTEPPPEPPPPGQDCDTAAPGAPSGSPVLGPTTYDASTGTITISNTIFDGSHSDDLVRVYFGHVIFDHVTFRGVGTGSTGHSLEVKQGGSVEVRNSVFEGAPSEDHLQFENNGASIVACNIFATDPGEEAIDLKPGAGVLIEANDFAAAGSSSILNQNSTGRVDVVDNSGITHVFYYNGATGSLVGNDVVTMWLYDAINVLVEENSIGVMKHGEGSSSRDPVDAYFLNNVVNDAVDNGGTCFRDGNTGADPMPFCTSGAPAWYVP